MLKAATIDDIPTEIRALIAAALGSIAREEAIRIVLAVESGSRAWGFPSRDSDYDVRFLYVRRAADYVSLSIPRDVIEPEPEGDLDLSGWDLRKALRLGLSWNPALVEWLTSPIIYHEEGWEAAALRRLFVRPQSRDALIRHYFALGHRQWGRFIEGRPVVKLKKYFYVVRPAVALHWLEVRPTDTPPMSLPALVESAALPRDVLTAMGELRDRKVLATELGEGARIPVLDSFIQDRLAWAAKHLPGGPPKIDRVIAAAAEAVFRASVFGETMPSPG